MLSMTSLWSKETATSLLSFPATFSANISAPQLAPIHAFIRVNNLEFLLQPYDMFLTLKSQQYQALT